MRRDEGRREKDQLRITTLPKKVHLRNCSGERAAFLALFLYR